MQKETYEKHIAHLEAIVESQSTTIRNFQTNNEGLQHQCDAKIGRLLKRSVVSLNTIYGRLGQIQGDILSQLNTLNNENLDATDKRMIEAMKILQELLPQQNGEID